MNRLQLFCFSGLAVALVWAAPLRAHDFWIEPSAFRPALDEKVSLVLRVGQNFTGNRLPYIPDWISDFRVTGPDGKHTIEGVMGDDPAGGFVPRAPGVYLAGYRSNRTFVEIEPEKFLEYLEKQGLEPIVSLREKRGESGANAREFFSRCAKTLVSTRGAGPGTGFDRVFGYTLELIPERNPYALAPGGALPLRLLYEGQPLPGALVVAFTSDRPEEKLHARTDADGRVRLRLPHPGVWLVSAVHMIPLPPSEPKAQWESFWASLTFELPPG